MSRALIWCLKSRWNICSNSALLKVSSICTLSWSINSGRGVVKFHLRTYKQSHLHSTSHSCIMLTIQYSTTNTHSLACTLSTAQQITALRLLAVPSNSSHLEIFALFHWRLSKVHPRLHLLAPSSLLQWPQQVPALQHMHQISRMHARMHTYARAMHTCTHARIHTQPFNGPLSGTTRWASTRRDHHPLTLMRKKKD